MNADEKSHMEVGLKLTRVYEQRRLFALCRTPLSEPLP